VNPAPASKSLQLPRALQRQLYDYRRQVWTIKIVEAVAVACVAVVMGFAGVFALDRFWNTSPALRFCILAAVLGGCLVVPWYLYRWVWGRRGLEQLARLLGCKLPQVGDQLLGIIELARDETEQTRSRALCEAAIQTVAHDAQRRNLREATPPSRHVMWSAIAAGSLATAVGLTLFLPSAALNAWARLLAPWKHTPRYTFASVQPLPDDIIVPHGESITITARLADDSGWRPAEGRVQLGRQQPVTAQLQNGRYAFELPPQIESGRLRLRIGDFNQVVHIDPRLRPEITSVVADVGLPDYLQRRDGLQKNIRGGSISIVKGSRATFAVTASRKLAAARVDGRPRVPVVATITSPQVDVDGERELEFRWEDEFGLAGKDSFTLTIAAHDDEPPSLTCEDLPRRKVMLDTEQILFQIKAHDDFGVKRVGMQWEGVENAVVGSPAKGQRILAAGGSEKVSLDIAGTFSARALGIEPQPIKLRAFAEDYFPGRERVYSPEYLLYVLSPEQHAIWMTEQLNKWHRQSLEVRDREMQLYETNKELRDLPPGELDRPDARRRIERQAAAERANGRRLSRLTARGEALIKEASRNPEFGVGYLEQWAEMLQILKDISASRMPSVADLLKAASRAEQLASIHVPGNQGPRAGKLRAAETRSASGGKEKDETKPVPVPQISDVESSQQPLPEDELPPSSSDPSAARLTLPTTTLIGGGPDNQACPAGEKMQQAVEQQADLLAEFEKIANELNNILANLEGSTLVKRLKAASRLQYRIAGRIGDELDAAFGRAPLRVHKTPKMIFEKLSEEETKSSHTVSLIMDDMSAYFARRRFFRLKTVLAEMKDQDVVGALRQLGDDIPEEYGLSIAQCEYWSDTLDRWAEDLVDPARGGQ